MSIELTTTTPDSGSAMPDLGHTAYWLKKELPKLEYKDANGKMRKLDDKFKITRISTAAS